MSGSILGRSARKFVGVECGVRSLLSGSLLGSISRRAPSTGKCFSLEFGDPPFLLGGVRVNPGFEDSQGTSKRFCLDFGTSISPYFIGRRDNLAFETSL